MKKLTTLAVAFALSIATAPLFADLEPQTIEGTINVSIAGNQQFKVVSYSHTADQQNYDDLGGNLEFGLVDAQNNIYNVGPDDGNNQNGLEPGYYPVETPATRADHYCEVRFYMANNIDLYKVTIEVSSPTLFTEVLPPNGTGTIMHVTPLPLQKNPDRPQDPFTKHPENITPGTYANGAIDLPPDTPVTLYQTAEPGADCFVAYIALDNIDISVQSGDHTGTVTYTMSAL